MSLAALIVAAAFAAPAAPVAQTAQADAPGPLRPIAVLRGLDKFSGLTADIDAVVGTPAGYERLVVEVRACHGDGPDSEAWLQIWDRKTPERPIFAGWMIASSPAVSALDHPRYDVWLLSCSTASGEAS